MEFLAWEYVTSETLFLSRSLNFGGKNKKSNHWLIHHSLAFLKNHAASWAKGIPKKECYRLFNLYLCYLRLHWFWGKLISIGSLGSLYTSKDSMMCCTDMPSEMWSYSPSSWGLFQQATLLYISFPNCITLSSD